MYMTGKYWWQSEAGECNTYGNWIATNYPNKESCVNKCNEAVREMTAHFSGLAVQVGFANRVYHCWCKDAEGNVVDPTAKQFDSEVIYTLVADKC